MEAAGSMTIVAAAQQARIVKWDDNGVVVALPEDSLEASIAGERDNITAVCKILSKRFGRPQTFDVTTFKSGDPSGQRSLVEIDRERADNERSERESEAREHPVTKMVLDAFGAEIKEIKTDG